VKLLGRRSFLASGTTALVFAIAGCAGDEPPSADTTTDPPGNGTTAPGKTTTPSTTASPPSGTPDGPPGSVTARRVASGFTAPVGFETVPGREGSWVVVDQDGRAWLYDGGGIRDRPYLDVRDRMVSINSNYDERGLLGLAFHPEFASNGTVYVRYSAPKREGTPANYSHTFVLSEFTADPTADRVPLDNERTVLEIPQPQGNHNAGAITFGPDGLLYVGVGDGGGGGDDETGHVEDWYDGVGGGNGQDVTENLLGSVLRIDVDGRDAGGYGIPRDNPLVGRPGLDEHYAWGFRNPWRMSFDGSDLYVGDVGQGAREEVDLVVAGGNYGWNVREGSNCYRTGECPTETPEGQQLQDPITEYSHTGDPPNGVSVIGGYRYRGSALGGLGGTYVFGDWRWNRSLFVAEPREDGTWPITVIEVETIGASTGELLLAFGRAGEELYVCTTDSAGPGGSTGAVFRLTRTD